MAAGEDALKVLIEIRELLKVMLARAGSASQASGTTPGNVASDRLLDGQYGNPEIKAKDPRDWTGDSMTGRRFSECPPDYLDMVASRLDYFADQAEATGETYNGKPVAPYKRKDAALARGWAARLRGGWTPTNGAAADTSEDDSIAF